MTTQAPAVNPAVLTVRQACDYAQTGDTLMRRLIAEKQIPSIRIGRAVRILRSDLDSFLEKQRSV